MIAGSFRDGKPPRSMASYASPVSLEAEAAKPGTKRQRDQTTESSSRESSPASTRSAELRLLAPASTHTTAAAVAAAALTAAAAATLMDDDDDDEVTILETRLPASDPSIARFINHATTALELQRQTDPISLVHNIEAGVPVRFTDILEASIQAGDGEEVFLATLIKHCKKWHTSN